MGFDPERYWAAQGPYLATASVSDEHIEVEQILRKLLSTLSDEIHSVIDVGCGGGRLAAMLKDVLPDAYYSGVDLAEAQLHRTADVRPNGSFYLSRLQDFEPGKTWDLALCSEVLLHIPPSDIQQAVRNLSLLSPLLVLVDWTKPVRGPIAEWNWLHDYRTLFSGKIEREIKSGLQTVFVIRTDA